MKISEFKFRLYLAVDRLKFALYLTAVLVIILPVSIVLATGIPLNSFYAKTFVNISVSSIIIGRILTAYKKTIDNDTIPWVTIGSIIGLLLVLVGNFNYL